MRNKTERITRMRRIGEVRDAVRRGDQAEDTALEAEREILLVTPAAPRNSLWQEAILEALADGELASTGRIMARLGITKPSLSERATVSRALRRLEAKGLIDRYEPHIIRVGRGYLWRLRRNG